MTDTIHVCATCEDRDAVRRAGGAGGGAAFLAALATRLADHQDGATFAVVPQGCMGPCGAGVRVGVTGPGRWGWLFQGLRADDDVEDFLRFLAAWRASPNGVLAKAERPAGLLRKTVGRLPPSAGAVVALPPSQPQDKD